MKKIIFISLLILITSCKAQKNNLKNSQMKTFDIETFEKNKDHLNEYTFITKDSTVIEQKERHYGFREKIKPQKSDFYTFNKYYKNGKLKMTGDYFPNDFEKGIWKEYDEQGKLIKETDYDAPYKFTWEDVLKFIKERNLKIDINNENFIISRGQIDNKYVWEVIHEKTDKSSLHRIVIDALNGKVIKEYDEDYPVDE